MRLVPVVLTCLAAVACDRTNPPASQPPVGELALMTAEQAAVTPVLSATCNLEKIDGIVVPDSNPVQVKARRFEVGGWVFDDSTKTLPAKLFVRVYSTSGDGRIWQHVASQTTERPDVRAAYDGAAQLLKSGFDTQLDTATLPAGKYSLRLAYDRAGQGVICDNGRAVVLN